MEGTTGYRIYYNGASSERLDIIGGSTDNYLLTDLQNGYSYNISITATSQHFYSESVETMATLSKILFTCIIVYK